ncbi:MAG: hypothetical protein ACM3II_15345, partial [Rhodospirillaceae bacterium]
MKLPLRALLLALAAAAGPAAADDEASRYSITSLNTPDALFVTSGDSVAISVTASPPPALRRLVVRLNGEDVTSAL